MEGWDIKNRAWVLVRAAYKLLKLIELKKDQSMTELNQNRICTFNKLFKFLKIKKNLKINV